MKIMIVTDAWEPQVNGVVRTLKQTRAELVGIGHQVEIITPAEFQTIPCPTYPDISLSLFPGKKVVQRIKEFAPDAIHIATEGPLGLSARGYAVKNKLPFSTAYHTRFPEYVKARIGIPLSWTYAFLRWFHGRSAGIDQELASAGLCPRFAPPTLLHCNEKEPESCALALFARSRTTNIAWAWRPKACASW